MSSLAQGRDDVQTSRFAGLSTGDGSSPTSGAGGSISGRRGANSSLRTRTSDWSLSVNTSSSSGDGQEQARYIGSGGRRRQIRYSKLELVQLYQPSALPADFEDPDNFVTVEECREPLNKTFFKMDKDTKINPDFVIARGRGVTAGPPSSSTTAGRGRGGASVGRGRGRGRGAPLSPSGGNDNMPAWATETIDREDRSMILRGFTDEEKDSILTPHSKQVGTSQVSGSVFDDAGETSLEEQGSEEETAPEEAADTAAADQSNATNEIDFDSMWLYKDTSGGIHGPFPLSKLNSWVEAAFFDPVIEVQQEGDTSFRILRDVIEAASATEQRRRRIEMGLPAEEEKKVEVEHVAPAAAVVAQPEVPLESALGDLPTEEQLLREQHISLDNTRTSPIKSILDVIDEQRPVQPPQQQWGQQHPYLQQAAFGATTQQGMIPPGMEQYYFAAGHPHYMHQHAAQQHMYPYQQYMMQQQQQQQLPQQQVPLSADQLEHYILQGGALPSDSVPQQQSPHLMAQLQQMQQYYWMQQQQQQFYAQQQQQRIAQEQEQHIQQQPVQQQQLQQQPVSIPQQQIRHAPSASLDSNPFDQTNRVEESQGEWKESQSKKSVEQQKAQPGQKVQQQPQQPQQHAAKPVAQQKAAPSQAAVQPVPAVQPHAVPAKPDVPKPADTQQVKPQAKVIEAKGDDFDESQFLYDRENKKPVGSVAVPQAKGWGGATPAATAAAVAQPQVDTSGMTLAEIQAQQDKERRKQLKKEQEQMQKEMEAKSQPVWGGAGAAQPQLSLLDIQTQEKSQSSGNKQHATAAPASKGPVTFASKVSKQTASSVPAPTSPSVWGSASSQGKSLKEIQDEEKRQAALEKKRVQTKGAAPGGTLAEQLAKNAKGTKGQTGVSKPAVPSAASVSTAQTVSPTKQKGTAVHYNDEEEEEQEDDEVDQEEDTLWDYTGNAKVDTNAFSSAQTVKNVAPGPAQASTATVGIAGAGSSSQKKPAKGKGSSFATTVGGGQSSESLGNDDFPSLRPAAQAGKKKGKSTSAEANAFGIKEVSDNLQQWFKKEVTSTLGQKYEATMLYFLMSVETDAEVDAYVQEYFGTSANAKKFGQQFKAYRDFEHNGGTGPFNPAQAVANKSKAEQDEFKQATKKRSGKTKITL